MYQWFIKLPPEIQALIATLFTWGMTAAGAAMIFLFKSVGRKVLDAMLGFAAGVMVAASFWSLLNPSIELAEKNGQIAWIPPAIGFLSGAIFLWILDKIIPHLHIDYPMEEAEGIHTHWRKSVLLVLAITLHNIPEGLAVGVAFGAASLLHSSATIAGALALALGIGIQNFPEGLAVAAPLRREGLSMWKSFNYGQLSGIVEPIAAVLGAALVQSIKPLLPYALSFAAGAMIYVVVEELIPESQIDKQTHISTFGFVFGFLIMMILDVSL